MEYGRQGLKVNMGALLRDCAFHKGPFQKSELAIQTMTRPVILKMK